MKDSLGAVQSVLVLGGRSEIGLAVATRLVRERARTVVLAGRDPEALEAPAAALREAGATTVAAVRFDATDFPSHNDFVQRVFDEFGDIDLVVFAFGVLGDQQRDEQDGESAVVVAETNYSGAVSAGVAVSQRLREQGHGTIVALSSVAGVKVRRSNFVYGSSKAGFDSFFLSLGDALVDSGARVLVVRPGFVRSRMTAGRSEAPLAATPEAVADAVATAVARGRSVVWVPAAMRLVMLVLRHLPRPVLRRLPV